VWLLSGVDVLKRSGGSEHMEVPRFSNLGFFCVMGGGGAVVVLLLANLLQVVRWKGTGRNCTGSGVSKAKRFFGEGEILKKTESIRRKQCIIGTKERNSLNTGDHWGSCIYKTTPTPGAAYKEQEETFVKSKKRILQCQGRNGEKTGGPAFVP